MVITGSGDSVVDMPPEWPAGLIAVVHIIGPNVRDNFIVKNYDAFGEDIDLLVNTIGAYDGYRPLDFYDDEQTARFEVQAGGPWTIKVIPLATAYSDHLLDVPGLYEGVGDEVVFLTGEEPDLAEITSGPERDNFVVRSIGRTRGDLLVNEIAPYSGTVIVPRDTRLLIVKATGPWSIEVSSP